MLQVTRTGQPRRASRKDDDYIPLAVDWVTVGSVRPVYYRVQAPDGGDIELKLEPLTGEIIGATVIDSPSRRVEVPPAAHQSETTHQGSVFVDLSAWQLNPDRAPTLEVVYEEGELGWGEDQTDVYFSWSSLKAATFVTADGVGFGVSENNVLTSIIATKR